MPAEISNDAEGVAATAGALGQMSQTWTDIGQRLQSAADAVGDCWGSDDVGQGFASGYVSAHQQLVSALLGNGQVGGGAAANATTAMRNLVDTDEDNAQTASSLDF